MKQLINQNADVLGLNSITLFISLTEVEQILQILALALGIVYTLDKYITYRRSRNGEKNNN